MTKPASPRETFADAMARGHGGRFDQMRLGAAILVIVSHAFEISEGARVNEPFLRFSAALTFGELAVLIFFVLSGFLLAQSLRRNASVKRFALRRARRILPGLAACVALLVFVAGPALTILPLAAYFGAPGTWSFLGNIVFAQDVRTLPGVFGAAPIGAAVNAPLWTLHYEVVCYALLAALAAAGRMGPRGCAVMIVALTVVHPLAEQTLPAAAAHYLRPLSIFGSAFFAGALFAELSGRIPRDARLALFAAAVFLATSALGRPVFGFLFAGLYVVLYVATSRPTGAFRRATRGADISYGVYLYGWPVQQFVVTAGLATSVAGTMAFGLLGAALAGVASWALVERRFLRGGEQPGSAASLGMNFLQNSPPRAVGAMKSPD